MAIPKEIQDNVRRKGYKDLDDFLLKNWDKIPERNRKRLSALGFKPN